MPLDDPPRAPGPTLEAVARAAGVSRSTVSRVVTGSPRVSPTARHAVEEAIERLGYVPNPAARSLVTRRTGTVALVVREPESRVFDEPFFGAVVRGVSQAMARTDLQLALLLAGASPPDDPDGEHERRRIERFLLGGHADGALLLSLHADDPLPRDLLAAGLPVVLAGRPSTPDLDVSWVDADNRGGGAAATEHLLASGRRRVGVLTGPLDMVAGRDRLDGYHDAHAARGLPVVPDLQARGDFTREGGAAAMMRLLASAPDVDGVVVASDVAALGALQVLAAAGRRVPEDVAVVGFDDSIVARSVQPALTTVRQPVEELGARMAQLLLARLAGEATTQQVVLPTHLVVRDSG